MKCTHILMFISGGKSLLEHTDNFAGCSRYLLVLPEYSFEWAYPDSSPKWMKEYAFICCGDSAGWLTHFPCACNSG